MSQRHVIVDRIAGHKQDVNSEGALRLADVLHENTLAGSNPAFDAASLTCLYETGDPGRLIGTPRWHHRLWDLSAYAAGVLRLNHLPGLAEVCELLDVVGQPDHSAETDATVTGMCFRELFARAQGGDEA